MPSYFSLNCQVLPFTHPNSQTLPWGDPLPDSPQSSSAVCSVGTRTWMNDLELSLFQMTGVLKCLLPIVLLKIHSLKKETWEEGGQRYGPTQPTYLTTPSTPGTPLMWHHVSVRDQTALLSVTGSNFLLSPHPSFVTPYSHLLPHVLFFPFSPPSLPLSSSLFCFVFMNNKGTPESMLETSFLSLALKKKDGPPLAKIPLLTDNTHRHTHAHVTLTALHWLWVSLYSSVHVHTMKQSAAVPSPVSHTHTHSPLQTHADTIRTTKLAANPSFINSSLGGFLTDTPGDVSLTHCYHPDSLTITDTKWDPVWACGKTSHKLLCL